MKMIACFPPAGFNHCERGLIGMFYNGLPIKCSLAVEQNNPYDKFAVRIDCKGNKIGYVPRGYVMNGTRSVPGNYNQFLSQCLLAGMEFDVIAVLKMGSRHAESGALFRGNNIYEYVPMIVVFPKGYLDNNDIGVDMSDNELSIDLIREITTFKHIAVVDYKDTDEKIWRNGNLYYNEYSDSFCVWNGTEELSWGGRNSVDIEILEENQNAKKTTKSAFLFIEKANINSQSILNRNVILKDENFIDYPEKERRMLYNKFLEKCLI